MAIITPTECPLPGYHFKMTLAKQGAQNDKIVFSDAGVALFDARIGKTGAAITITRNVATINNGGTLSAATTSIPYMTATASDRNAGNYYVQIENELIYVGADSGYNTTSGNMAGAVRGALGTTAATHADGTPIYIMNSFNLGDNQTSLLEFFWAPYPSDPKGRTFTFT